MYRSVLALLAVLALQNFLALADKEPELQRVKRVSSTAIKDDVVKFDDMTEDRKDRQSGNELPLDFPIILPPYNYIDLKEEDFGSCLLYLESISIVVFASGDKVKTKRDFSSASAVIRGGKSQKNKFLFDQSFVKCYGKNNATSKEFSFRIKVDVKEAAEAKLWNGEQAVLFSVDRDIDLTLKFKINPAAGSWNLIDLQLNEPIVVNNGDWLSKDLQVDAGSSSLNAALVNFGGFNDYNYACSSTPLIAWPLDKDSNAATVGISFDNIQIQAFDIKSAQTEDEKKSGRVYYRFGSSVNDCVSTFSVGSLMSIVSILVFLLGLSFGYLMLNSVQTMDRFDDPKQKQLIINAKD